MNYKLSVRKLSPLI